MFNSVKKYLKVNSESDFDENFMENKFRSHVEQWAVENGLSLDQVGDLIGGINPGGSDLYELGFFFKHYFIFR